MKRRAALAVVLVVSLVSATVHSEPMRFKTPAQCTTEGGSDVALPIGRFIPEDDWQELDKKWKDKEDDNTRLTAENKVYVSEQSVLGWKSALAAAALGVAFGGWLWKD